MEQKPAGNRSPISTLRTWAGTVATRRRLLDMPYLRRPRVGRRRCLWQKSDPAASVAHSTGCGPSRGNWLRFGAVPSCPTRMALQRSRIADAPAEAHTGTSSPIAAADDDTPALRESPWRISLAHPRTRHRDLPDDPDSIEFCSRIARLGSSVATIRAGISVTSQSVDSWSPESDRRRQMPSESAAAVTAAAIVDRVGRGDRTPRDGLGDRLIVVPSDGSASSDATRSQEHERLKDRKSAWRPSAMVSETAPWPAIPMRGHR